MFEFLLSILTWIINFFMGLFGFKKDKQVSFNETVETSAGETHTIAQEEQEQNSNTSNE
jgi:hypothetical protein